jgi:hypothetical protein
MTKKILFGLMLFIAGTGFAFAQEADSTAAEPEVTEKPLAKAAFESGICMDNQTVAIPPSKTLEFVLQHRFGVIQNGWSDLAGIWGASNIRMGLNFSITENVLVGLGTTKNNRLQDLQVKYTFLRQRKEGGFPVTIAYYGNLSLNATDKVNFGTGYKFSDRLAWYHEFMIARRFCNEFSAQLGISYTHFNKVDKTMDSTATNDALGISLLARVKVSPQSSIVLSYLQPLLVNYDPAFIVRAGKDWISVPDKAPYANVSLGWEISTSTHAFHIYMSAANGIVPSEVVMHNTNNFFNGFILLGFNMTRLWGF